jgi:hypothetical protein
MVRTGHSSEIYDENESNSFETRLIGGFFPTFDHPAYETLLFIPFSYFGYVAAYFDFLAFNLVAFAASIVMLRPYISGLELIGRAAPWAVPFAFLPVALALILGQDSLILLAIMAGAFVLLEKERGFAAGFVLALGLFKFQFVIPIALLFFVWRRWKVVGGIVAGGILALAISVWITGFAAITALIHTLTTMSVGLATDAEKYHYGTFPDRMPNIRGLLCTITGISSGKGIAVATLLCSLVLIGFASRKKPSLPLAIIVAILGSYHGFMNDACLLVVPVARAMSLALPEGKTYLFFAAAAVLVAPPVLFWLQVNNSWMVLPIVALVLSY